MRNRLAQVCILAAAAISVGCAAMPTVQTELDVLDAQQRLYAAEFDLAQARNDYLFGLVRLSKAAGELSEDDMRALNGFLVR